MSVRPSSHQRPPGAPLTFVDISPEVVRNAFVYLSPKDLASVRLVCRGFNPTAQDVMMSRMRAEANRIFILSCGL
jgi:hypothetical protein